MSQTFPYICHHYNNRTGCKTRKCPYLHICKLYIWDIPHQSRCYFYHGISMSDKSLLESLGLNASSGNILNFIRTFCAGQHPPRFCQGRISYDNLRPKLELPKPCRFYDSAFGDNSDVQCKIGRNCKFLHICSNLDTSSSFDCDECQGELKHIPTTQEMAKLSYCCFDTRDPIRALKLYKTIMGKILCKNSNFEPASRPESPLSMVSVSSLLEPSKLIVPKRKPCEKHETKPCSEHSCPMFEFQGDVLWCAKQSKDNQDGESEWLPLPEVTMTQLEGLYSDPCNEKAAFSWNGTEFKVTFSNKGVECTSGGEILRLFYQTSSELTWTWYWESNIELNQIFKHSAFPKLLREFYSFDNKNKRWCPYGKKHSASDLATTFDSEYLEKLQNVSASLSVSGVLQTFKVGTQVYNLDIEKFTQVNTKSEHVRNIRRRPTPGLCKDVSLTQSDSASIRFPNWFSEENQSPRAIALDNSSEEAICLKTIVKKKQPNLKMVKVFKIQNDLLWKKYYVTRQELMNKFKNGGMNEALLFHGTTTDAVSKIIERNFDWRLSGTRVGEILGSGTYFSPNFETSWKYGGSESSKIIFVSLVLIGQFTVGKKEFRRPPENPKGGFYDSCVDNLDKPDKIAIFDNNQCYPLYYIEVTP